MTDHEVANSFSQHKHEALTRCQSLHTLSRICRGPSGRDHCVELEADDLDAWAHRALALKIPGPACPEIIVGFRCMGRSMGPNITHGGGRTRCTRGVFSGGLRGAPCSEYCISPPASSHGIGVEESDIAHFRGTRYFIHPHRCRSFFLDLGGRSKCLRALRTSTEILFERSRYGFSRAQSVHIFHTISLNSARPGSPLIARSMSSWHALESNSRKPNKLFAYWRTSLSFVEYCMTHHRVVTVSRRTLYMTHSW